jgi:hypothetical protein
MQQKRVVRTFAPRVQCARKSHGTFAKASRKMAHRTEDASQSCAPPPKLGRSGASPTISSSPVEAARAEQRPHSHPLRRNRESERLLVTEDRPPLPDGITFHSLRRTYAALRAELGEHPAITAAQMGHRDPRMTLRVYTDVTGMRPKTRMGALLGDGELGSWAPVPNQPEVRSRRQPLSRSQKVPQLQAQRGAGATGLEPATSGVTGRRSNQLSYAPESFGWALLRGPGRQS